MAAGDTDDHRRVHHHEDEGEQPSHTDQPVGARRDRRAPRTTTSGRARRDRDPRWPTARRGPWGSYFRRARKRAGLADSITFHDLRHFFASVLIASGCSIKQVQMALGHDSARITLDTYAHLMPGDEDRLRDAIESRFRSHRVRDVEI
jgi:integrase